MQPPTHQQQGMGAMNPQAQQQAGPGVMGGAGQAGGFGGAWGFDNPTAALGMQLGQNAVAAGQDYVQRNVRLSISCSPVFVILTRAFLLCVVWSGHADFGDEASFQCVEYVCDK